MIENGLKAAIVQGYADNGNLSLEGAERADLLDDDGNLIRYNSLEGILQGRFDSWMGNDEHVSAVAHEAFQEAER